MDYYGWIGIYFFYYFQCFEFFAKISASSFVVEQYCEGETFKGDCPEGHVIFLQTALYGRMRAGRCVEGFEEFGCSNNVISELDVLCSGRRTCDVRVSLIIDLTRKFRNDCLRNLRGYLEVAYTCIPVLTFGAQSCCQYGQPPTPVKSPSAYIASAVVTSPCGTPECPWVIEAQSGQRVQVTMYDFNVTSHSNIQSVCHVYVTIKDTEQTHTVCGQTDRKVDVFTSKSNWVELRLVSRNRPENYGYYLLHYEAIGCPDISRPERGWVKRVNGLAGENDVMYVGCNDTNKSWRLECIDGLWRGAYSNCTDSIPATAAKTETEFWKFFLGKDGGSVNVAIIAILLIAVGIGCTILIVGLAILRRRRMAPPCPPRPPSAYISRSGEQVKVINPTATYQQPYNDYYASWRVEGQAPPRSQTYTGSSDTRNQYTEHVYESPKFSQRDSDSEREDIGSTQYFELDPNASERMGPGPVSDRSLQPSRQTVIGR